MRCWNGSVGHAREEERGGVVRARLCEMGGDGLHKSCWPRTVHGRSDAFSSGRDGRGWVMAREGRWWVAALLGGEEKMRQGMGRGEEMIRFRVRIRIILGLYS